MRITIVAAVSENGVIGRGNALPWHLPKDLEHFKRLTSGHTIVMGRRTWESIGGRPLPRRRTIVISRSPGFRPEGATVVPTFEAAVQAAGEMAELFVVGGRGVFEAALPAADRLELTRVHATVEGNAFFPPLDLSQWTLVREERQAADETHAYPFSFLRYDRRH